MGSLAFFHLEERVIITCIYVEPNISIESVLKPKQNKNAQLNTSILINRPKLNNQLYTGISQVNQNKP